MHAVISVSVVFVMLQHTAVARQQYGMYVWTTGFDRNIQGCDVTEFMKWNSHGHCFTHTWNTAEKRQWLWATCSVPGREIDAIFISDVHHNLKNAYNANSCDSSDIAMVKTMLKEGHTWVPDLKIYGLYAVSDMAVSEQNLVKYIVYYNDHCAENAMERFDGIATNNEAYASIKCGDLADRTQYLDNLDNIVTEAEKQVNGKLLTHYSMSWHWGRCSGSPDMMTWRGKSATVNEHMIDIFDSTDVQVGYIQQPQIADRMRTAEIDYAQSLNKPIFTTVYTNKGSPCQITFFPDDTCHIGGHTESGMFAAFDSFTTNGISYARPCIHYFRGIYSTGVHPDWPTHDYTCKAYKKLLRLLKRGKKWNF